MQKFFLFAENLVSKPIANPKTFSKSKPISARNPFFQVRSYFFYVDLWRIWCLNRVFIVLGYWCVELLGDCIKDDVVHQSPVRASSPSSPAEKQRRCLPLSSPSPSSLTW